MEGSRLSRSIGLADAVGLRRSLVKAGQLPFEQLPNLPKPLIPVIDLGIGSRTDIKAIGYERAVDYYNQSATCF